MISHRRRHLKRYREILAILIKYGFKEILNRLRIGYRLRFGLKKLSESQIRENVDKPFAIRLRLVFEELGPTFIKFGQMLSMRPDLLPKNIIIELQRLQDQVPPFSFREVEEIIMIQFNCKLNELFKSFEQKPIAAASIAQCHKAQTRDGRLVAVKIRRPGIQQIIQTDIEILKMLAALAEKSLPNLRVLNPTGVIEEFALSMQYEIDFFKEGRNIEAFKKFFDHDDTVYIPVVYWDLCTDSVLCMEYIDGIKISQIDQYESKKLDRKLIAVNGAKSFFKQVFSYGFFHADPHPGNIFVLDNNVLAPVDFGIVGYIDDEMQRELGKALIAFVNKDANGMIKILRNLDLIDSHVVTKGLRSDLKNLINYYYDIKLSQINLGTIIMEILDIIRKHHIRIPTDLVLMAKAVVTIEALGRELDPDFDIVSIAKPAIRQLMISNLNPLKRMKDITNLLDDTTDLLKNFPEDIHNILKKMRTDKLKLKLEHTGMDYFTHEMDKASNRLSFSVIIAAMIVGSSLIMHLNKGPFVFGVPIIGLIGFIAAGIFGFWLIIAIIKSGRL